MIVRDLARRHSNWRADASPRRVPGAATAFPAIAGDRHPSPHAPPARARGRCRARSAPTSPRAARGRARASEHRRHATSWRPSPRPRPTWSASDDAPFHGGRLRLRHQAHDPAPPRRRRAAASRWCRRRTPRGRGAGPGPRRRVPVQRPGRPGAVVGARRRRCGTWSGAVPVFGICLGHQILALALGGSTLQAARSATTARNHPVRHLATGRVEITSQNHNYAVDADSLAEAATVALTHVNLNDGVVRGTVGCPDAPRLRRAVPPRGRPGTARRPLPVRRLHRAHDGLPGS